MFIGSWLNTYQFQHVPARHVWIILNNSSRCPTLGRNSRLYKPSSRPNTKAISHWEYTQRPCRKAVWLGRIRRHKRVCHCLPLQICCSFMCPCMFCKHLLQPPWQRCSFGVPIDLTTGESQSPSAPYQSSILSMVKLWDCWVFDHTARAFAAWSFYSMDCFTFQSSA